MTGLSAVLAGDRAPDVFHYVPTPGAGDTEVGDALRDSAWTSVRVDGWACHSRHEALLDLGRALDFPEWFTGRNLDAFWDHLRDLPGPSVVIWDGWSTFARADPDGFAAVVSLLRARAAEERDLVVLLRGDGPALDVPDLV